MDVFAKANDFTTEETMAFGDGGNDLEMIQHARTWHCNGAMEQKNSRKHLSMSQLRVDEDGIANAIHTVLLSTILDNFVALSRNYDRMIADKER
jgi:hydroxymethylpyrimidine pyrophosphatase-like HAD family hydrolase